MDGLRLRRRGSFRARATARRLGETIEKIPPGKYRRRRVLFEIRYRRK